MDFVEDLILCRTNVCMTLQNFQFHLLLCMHKKRPKVYFSGDLLQFKNVTCADRAAVAVGRTAMSSSDMITAGMRGKGVIVLHTYRDQLW